MLRFRLTDIHSIHKVHHNLQRPFQGSFELQMNGFLSFQHIIRHLLRNLYPQRTDRTYFVEYLRLFSDLSQADNHNIPLRVHIRHSFL